MYQKTKSLKRKSGSGMLNPGAVFLRFVTEAFLLVLAPAGGPLTLRGQFSNPAGQSLTLN